MPEGFVTLAQGQGGEETWELLASLVFSRVRVKSVAGGVGLDWPDDGATVPLPDGTHLVVSVDSYTVNPPFFPGGNIGSLAAAGTINDLVVMGARPVAALDTIVVEEGFPLSQLEEIVESMVSTFEKEGVALIGGDFKVMPKGQLDKVVVTTVGLGVAKRPIVDKPKPGDKLVVTGPVGDHGAVILLVQMGLGGAEEISQGLLKSDSKPLTRLLSVLEKHADSVHAARDPTRSGLAGILSEWARSTGTIMVVDSESVPVREPVRRYAEMLGVDPLYLASEGAAVLSVEPGSADAVVEDLRAAGFEEASIIGEVRVSEKFRGLVVLRTPVGGHRILEPPRGVLVPRIC